MKILYEGKFRKIEEEESDHIHLEDGTVIRKTEIINLPFGVKISKYSQKKQIKRLMLMKITINNLVNEREDKK